MNNNQIHPIQERAIHLLLAGTSIAAAARGLNIDRSTIYNWRNNNPAFSLALQNARRLQTETLADSLQDLASTAVETLRELLVSKEVPPAVRLRAALAVLKNNNQQQPDPEPEIQHNSTEFDSTNDTAGPVSKIGRNERCPCGSTAQRDQPCDPPQTQAHSTPIPFCACSQDLKCKRCCGHFNASPQHQAA